MGFKRFLLENENQEYILERQGGGGAEAGQYEIVKTPIQTAVKLVDVIYKNNHTVSPKKLLPDFVKNYKFAQQLATLGKTQRKDMPVIRRSDAFMLQKRLERGSIDMKAPFAKDTDPANPFPEGLPKGLATKWLTNGWRDGKFSDDMVKCYHDSKPAGSLKPIQQQIYLDKALAFGLKFQKPEFQKMVGNSFMISSKDNFIVDGHHRWLFAVLVDPRIKMSTLVIDLPLKELLKMLLTYTDAIGNERNK